MTDENTKTKVFFRVYHGGSCKSLITLLDETHSSTSVLLGLDENLSKQWSVDSSAIGRAAYALENGSKPTPAPAPAPAPAAISAKAQSSAPGPAPAPDAKALKPPADKDNSQAKQDSNKPTAAPAPAADTKSQPGKGPSGIGVRVDMLRINDNKGMGNIKVSLLLTTLRKWRYSAASFLTRTLAMCARCRL